MYKFAVTFADRSLRFLLPLALGLTTYLYLYPVFHGCVFPATDGSRLTAWNNTIRSHLSSSPFPGPGADPTTAPFRLLTLADPQLAGDTSLPKPEDAFLPKLKRHWKRLRTDGDHVLVLAWEIIQEIVFHDFPVEVKALRKRIDLFGNDYYLGHIFRTLHWWTNPSHVTVLGDLIGSQWTSDEEFNLRGWRYWNRVFAGGRRVEDAITAPENKEEEHVFTMGDTNWIDRIINIAGNHDIGYAGDISPTRMDRFERVFGKANWDVRFQYPASNGSDLPHSPSLHLIVLNSLVLDTPALSDDIRHETFQFLNDLMNHRIRPVEDRSSFTLLLTHVPLHKKEGTCVDAPFFDYWPDDDGGGVYKPHGLREQNHLSEQTSHQGMLQSLLGMGGNLDAPAQGMGRNGLILTGHDHEGCDTWHFVPAHTVWSASDLQEEEKKETLWDVCKWHHRNRSASHTGVREVTLRSMMGDYGGNAGLLSAWFDHQHGEWKYDIQMCGLNLIAWWAIHIFDLIVLGTLCFGLIAHRLPERSSMTAKREASSPKDKARGKVSAKAPE